MVLPASRNLARTTSKIYRRSNNSLTPSFVSCVSPPEAIPRTQLHITDAYVRLVNAGSQNTDTNAASCLRSCRPPRGASNHVYDESPRIAAKCSIGTVPQPPPPHHLLRVSLRPPPMMRRDRSSALFAPYENRRHVLLHQSGMARVSSPFKQC